METVMIIIRSPGINHRLRLWRSTCPTEEFDHDAEPRHVICLRGVSISSTAKALAL